jgi:thiamine pyrophosphokinase
MCAFPQATGCLPGGFFVFPKVDAMRVVLFANGALPEPERVRPVLRDGDVILAADGGARHALALGLQPHHLIGDCDSLTPAEVEALRVRGCVIEQHPRDKDATDLELALAAARRLGAREVLLLGVLGGRLDQELANLLLLAAPAWADLHLSLTDGRQTAWIVRERLDLRGRPGDTVSVLALSPQVEGLTYEGGLRWLLDDFCLPFGSTRGISNEMTAAEATIRLRRGVLLVIHMPAS